MSSQNNENGWSNPKAKEQSVKARGERDLAPRKKAYAEVQQLISEQGGVLIPYFTSILQATRTNVKRLMPVRNCARTFCGWRKRDK